MWNRLARVCVASVIMLCTSAGLSLAQERAVSGRVTDADTGESLPSVNIRVDGTMTGTTTDAQGRYRVMVSGADAALVFSFVGYAQQTIPVGDRTTINVALQPDRGALQEVIVTAQRRQESLQQVPVSVATASGPTLDAVQSAGSDIRDVAGRVPSLNAEGSNGNIVPRFYIRGLGNTDFDLNASQPVVVILDDVVQENVLLKSQMLFDLAQVEVLRGPQGTLFGATRRRVL